MAYTLLAGYGFFKLRSTVKTRLSPKKCGGLGFFSFFVMKRKIERLIAGLSRKVIRRGGKDFF